MLDKGRFDKGLLCLLRITDEASVCVTTEQTFAAMEIWHVVVACWRCVGAKGWFTAAETFCPEGIATGLILGMYDMLCLY